MGGRVDVWFDLGDDHCAGVTGGGSSSREKKADLEGYSSSFSESDVVDCEADLMRYTILDGRAGGIPCV